MKFTELQLTTEGVDYVFAPYDRGASGAFVYRENGQSVFQPRVVVSTATNDTASDKYVAQLNVPRTCISEESCGLPVSVGTDLVKTELRFLATTSQQDRLQAIGLQISLLQELSSMIANREVMYS